MIAAGLNISERSVRRALDRVYEHLGARPARRGDRRRESQPERALLVDWGSEPPRSDKDYRIEQMIGSGAFSKVYAATELATGRRVAVKWLRKAFWCDSRAAAAFARERDLVRLVDHPGVLKVAAWGRSRSGGVFLVMDLIEGVPLDRWRTTINPEVDQASFFRVVTSLVDALCAVHAHGVVHGDLKPANVLVTHDGRCVVCDFGFGHRCSDTVPPPIGGTAGYLAPEQVCDSFGPVTPRTDVYGLGATIYFMLTGQAPWRGRDVGDVVAKTISGESPLVPSQTIPGFAEGWSAVVRTALSKEPGERFESIAAMGQALRRIEAS